MIIFPENLVVNDIKKAYKWMWHPTNNIVAVASNKNSHISIYRFLKSKNNSIPDFYDWIRFIHLNKEDFKENMFNEPLLCIRVYENKLVNNDQLFEMIRKLGIESKIIFDVTNEKLKNLTGNYNEKY